MCGRFAFDGTIPDIRKQFDVDVIADDLAAPSWNIKPTQTINVVAETSHGTDETPRRLEPAYWSLIPIWAKEKRLRFPTFNARSETVLEKPTFRVSAKSQRCIIPASGYYEWLDEDGTKTPYYFYHDSALLGIAGLYSWWRPSEDTPWELTVTVLTRDASEHVAWVHDRMPVLVPVDLQDDWLSPEVAGADIVPAVAAEGVKLSDLLEWHAVAPLRGDGPELISSL